MPCAGLLVTSVINPRTGKQILQLIMLRIEAYACTPNINFRTCLLKNGIQLSSEILYFFLYPSRLFIAENRGTGQDHNSCNDRNAQIVRHVLRIMLRLMYQSRHR